MRTKPAVLSEQEAIQAVKEIPGWSINDGMLFRELVFANFQEAFSFMTAAALFSEKIDHHPDWSNVYNKVIIRLTTHECGGLSQRDINWAKEANRILKTYGK